MCLVLVSSLMQPNSFFAFWLFWAEIFTKFPELHSHISCSMLKLWMCINLLCLKIFPRREWLQQFFCRFYDFVLSSFSHVTLNTLCKIHALIISMCKWACYIQKMELHPHGMLGLYLLVCWLFRSVKKRTVCGRQKVIWPMKL